MHHGTDFGRESLKNVETYKIVLPYFNFASHNSADKKFLFICAIVYLRKWKNYKNWWVLLNQMFSSF